MEDEKHGSTISRAHFAKLYVFTMMWSIGAFLELSDRIKLEEFMRNNEEFKLDMPQIPEGSDDTMFDYFVGADGMWDFSGIIQFFQSSIISLLVFGINWLPRQALRLEDNNLFHITLLSAGNWAHWNTKVEPYHYPSDHTPEYGDILVPMVDNVRTDFLIQTIGKKYALIYVHNLQLTLLFENSLLKLGKSMFIVHLPECELHVQVSCVL